MSAGSESDLTIQIPNKKSASRPLPGTDSMEAAVNAPLRSSSSSARGPSSASKTRKRRGDKVHKRAQEIAHDLAVEEEHHQAAWLDGPLAITLLPLLGSYFTGDDIVKDTVVLALLFYYLRALIKTPWDLYLKARARRSSVSLIDDEHDDDVTEPEHISLLRSNARSELRLAEVSYLGLCLLTPFLGTMLLQYTTSLLMDGGSLSWFSSGLFMLATGIRPWKHLINLLTARTESLHDIVHHPVIAHPSESSKRVEDLEEKVKELFAAKDASKESNAVSDEQQRSIIARLEESIEYLEEQFRNSRRAEDVARLDNEARYKEMQKAMEGLIGEIDQLHRRVTTAATTAAAANATATAAAAAAKSPTSPVTNGDLLWTSPQQQQRGIGGSGNSPGSPTRRSSGSGRRPSSLSPTRGSSQQQTPRSPFSLGGAQFLNFPGLQGEQVHPNAPWTERILHFIVQVVLMPVRISQNLVHRVVAILGVEAEPSSPRQGIRTQLPQPTVTVSTPKGSKSE